MCALKSFTSTRIAGCITSLERSPSKNWRPWCREQRLCAGSCHDYRSGKAICKGTTVASAGKHVEQSVRAGRERGGASVRQGRGDDEGRDLRLPYVRPMYLAANGV